MLNNWRSLISCSFFLISLNATITHGGLTTSAESSHLQLERAFAAFQNGYFADAKTIWQALAEQGVSSAQINLAALYDSGKGVAADPARAAALYRAAAGKGNQFAQYNLALMHLEGRGVSKDRSIAEKWLQKAAAQNMALAQYQLGMLYTGVDPPSDTNGASPEPSQDRLAPDLDRALGLIYASGISFAQESDTKGLQQAILTLAWLAPGDRRIRELQARFEALKHQNGKETSQATTGTAFGTAWSLENGYVVTNYHVIAGSREVVLQNVDGQKVRAWPVLYDQAHDLALLAVEDAVLLPPALPLSSAETPLGSSVFTLGFPRVDVLGYAPKYTEGIIESDRGPLGSTDRYLTTVDIQPGNSGGPLLNSSGEVVGVITAMLGLRNEVTGTLQILPNQSCAVKTVNVRQLMDQLPNSGQYNRPVRGRGQPLRILLEKLKDCMLVVIAEGES